VRYAIWTAVSTQAQAEDDKASLPEQEIKCKSLGDSRGWIDTKLRYVVPGESRTRYVNLRDAEAEIPPLRKMLDDAQSHKFDLIMLYDFSRLRDLLDPVSKTLSHYGVQLYSVSQPVEPVSPDVYSPYASDASSMMQGLSRIISQAQVSDLRRKYAYAMPRRVAQRGLPIHIPWGYRKAPGHETDSNAVPIQEAEKCKILIQAKDLYLGGASMQEVAEMFIASGFPPPGGGKTWHPQTIRDLLRNPFFTGAVRIVRQMQ
jgi:hypothetical protein